MTAHLKDTDDRHVLHNPTGRGCSFCHKQGHTHKNCHKKISYGPELVQDEDFKMEYTKLIELPNHFKITHKTDPRMTIRKSILSSKGIIIHEKLQNNDLIISLIDRKATFTPHIGITHGI